jgi:formate dehydrogenase major subunit
MAELDTGQGGQKRGLSRRDFLKAGAAATVAGCAFEFWGAEQALAYEDNPAYKIYTTTCPYCSASCGQRVVTKVSDGSVVDIYGDFESPMNSGGLCAKGAGSIQLVTNSRRIGAYPAPHPNKNMDGTSDNVFAYDSGFPEVAYKRTGNGNWGKITLSQAMTEISAGLITARNSHTGWNPGAASYNSKGVAFFGSSHMNNESNYLYRKIIANFGTSNVEHQARI